MQYYILNQQNLKATLCRNTASNQTKINKVHLLMDKLALQHMLAHSLSSAHYLSVLLSMKNDFNANANPRKQTYLRMTCKCEKLKEADLLRWKLTCNPRARSVCPSRCDTVGGSLERINEACSVLLYTFHSQADRVSLTTETLPPSLIFTWRLTFRERTFFTSCSQKEGSDSDMQNHVLFRAEDVLRPILQK